MSYGISLRRVAAMWTWQEIEEDRSRLRMKSMDMDLSVWWYVSRTFLCYFCTLEKFCC